MSLLRTRRKKIFVSVAVLHAILIAAMSVLDAAGVKTFSGVVNLIFLSTYAVFFTYCIFSDLFSFFKQERSIRFVKRKGLTVLVHVSSLILVMSLIYNQLYFYRGSVILTEGEVFSEETSPFVVHDRGLLTERNEFERFISEAEIQLLELEFGTDEIPQTVRLSLNVHGEKKIISFGPNNPGRIGNHYFFVTSFSGYSPRVKIQDEDLVYLDAFLALKKSEERGVFEDSFNLGPAGKIIFRYKPKTNVFYILRENGHLISSGSSERPAFLNDMAVTIEEVRKWSKIDISMDRTPPLMFFGSALLLLSLFLLVLQKRGA